MPRRSRTIGSACPSLDALWPLTRWREVRRGWVLSVRGLAPHLLALFEYVEHAARGFAGFPWFRVRSGLRHRFHNARGWLPGPASWQAGRLLLFLHAWLGDGGLRGSR